MDRLTSLSVFVRVVENGGFSAAARRLNMSTTMVGNHVQSLEDRLGARLLNRTTRRVSLTEIGKTYYDRCLRILSEIEEADSLASALQVAPRGLLRLHAGTYIARFLAPVVAEYLAKYPAVSVDMAIADRMVDLVEEGYDLAIRTTPPPDSTYIIRRVTPWSATLCCSPAYLETHEAPRRPADLGGHNCLRYAFYPFGDEWHFTGPNGEPVSVKVTGSLVSNSAEVLRHTALAGQGIMLGPSFVIEEDIRSGRLVRLIPDHEAVQFAISAIYPSRHHLSAKVRTFIDLVAERFAEHRRWMAPNTA